MKVSNELNVRLNELVSALNALGRSDEKVRWSEKQKFCNIDIGSSGAWMVEKATGELYNIKAYGVPDRNKKAKANLGNVFTVDPAFLFARRYNYLR